MPRNPIVGAPGLGTARTATPKSVLHSTTGAMYLGNAAVLDGSESRDATNTSDVDKLQPGMCMGIITASGLWAPSFVGLTTAAYTSGGTSLTVAAATATELLRLCGATGTSEFVVIGAPSVSGTVAVTAATHSAISGTAITVTSLGVNKTAGSIIAVNDGRYTPRGILDTDYPVKVTNIDGDSVDQGLPRMLVGGFVDIDQIVNYPATANTTLVTWLKTQLETYGPWLFTDNFGV